MTYDIRNINKLETDAATLASNNQKVMNHANSLNIILNQIKSNWQNEAGTDLATTIAELTKCINDIQNAINPTISKYVDTMNTLVAESRTTQSKTM